MSQTRKAITGAEAAAEAMRQINPDVVAAYPITPQTPIMHAFAQYVADGAVSTELIDVESEHSAMSACIGAASAGARAMTATSANGLAYMWEVVYIAASNRLPIVMNVVNRALSGPINIHCDHSDSMGCRDAGWLQLYAESAQEAYDYTLMAVRIAEHTDIFLPVMVCQDGFITSHAVETVEVLDDDTARRFVGEPRFHHSLLDLDKPVTSGPLDFFDYYFEHKRQQLEAMEKVKPIMLQIFSEYSKLTGRNYDYFEKYRLDDADIALVAMSSSAGTAKDVVDELRQQGKKAGLLKVRVFRPFMWELVPEALSQVNTVGVMDRSASFGAFGGPLFTEIKNALYEQAKKPKVINYIYGLGGREMNKQLLNQAFRELEFIKKTNDLGYRVRCLGVRE